MGLPSLVEDVNINIKIPANSGENVQVELLFPFEIIQQTIPLHQVQTTRTMAAPILEEDVGKQKPTTHHILEQQIQSFSVSDLLSQQSTQQSSLQMPQQSMMQTPLKLTQETPNSINDLLLSLSSSHQQGEKKEMSTTEQITVPTNINQMAMTTRGNTLSVQNSLQASKSMSMSPGKRVSSGLPSGSGGIMSLPFGQTKSILQGNQLPPQINNDNLQTVQQISLAELIQSSNK